MNGASPIERVLRHERRVTAGGLALLCLIAWAYLVTGAGLGMSLGAMTTTALFPHSSGGGGMEAGTMAAQGAWSLVYSVLMVLMWWIMMIAMMLPSAAPMILLHTRVARAAQAKGRDPEGVLEQTAVFLGGYLLVWLAFSSAATALHAMLERSGLVSAMTMWSLSGPLSAALLVGAGVYQLTPFKNACLTHCRAPVQFLSRHWRPGRRGALRLGAVHGAYCVGCCWALMALLFVGGVMNPVWIVALTAIVLVEKLAPRSALTTRLGGAVLIVWGFATLWV